MQAIQYIGTITWIKITPQKILLNLMNKRRHFKVMCVLCTILQVKPTASACKACRTD